MVVGPTVVSSGELAGWMAGHCACNDVCALDVICTEAAIEVTSIWTS